MAKQFSLLFDARRCIGCRTCVIACKAENHIAAGSDEGTQSARHNHGCPCGSIPSAYPLLAGSHLYAL